MTTLPAWLQPVAWALPPTYVFEGMRALLIDHTFRADLMLEALALNVVFFAAGVFGFLKLLRSGPPQRLADADRRIVAATPKSPSCRRFRLRKKSGKVCFYD